MVSLKLTQKELERRRGEIKEEDVVIESLWEAAMIRTVAKQGKRRGAGEVTKRQRYDIGVQECFYGFARAVRDRVLDCAKLEEFEFCFDWENVARSRKNRGGMVGKRKDGSLYLVGQNEMVPRCPFQLATQIKWYTSSEEDGIDGLLRHVVEMELRGERWKSIRSAGKTEKCAEQVKRHRCLRQRTK